MLRIFLSEAKAGSPAELTGERAFYISSVLRMKQGESLIVHDASGSSYSARITRFGRNSVSLEIGEQVPSIPESGLKVRLFQGILKGEKMDLVIQKAVELGVSEVIPVITERGQVRHTRKLDRWRKIALEACRLTGRPVVPLINDVIELREVCAARNEASHPGIVFWEVEGEAAGRVLQDFRGAEAIDLLIGSEGGLSAEEVRQAAASGFRISSLGSRVMRAETAAIAAMAIVQYALGDIGSF